MLTKIASIAVLVNDAEKAAKWYQEKLGFELESRQGHWVTVRPHGSKSVVLHLCERCREWGDDKPGGSTGLFMKCDNKETTYKEMKDSGVEFTVDLKEFPMGGGKYAIFKDLDGNEFWM
jgi:catechol 2,3-dioxygenase-like lactoylglutathione lyase family enzyme